MNDKNCLRNENVQIKKQVQYILRTRVFVAQQWLKFTNCASRKKAVKRDTSARKLPGEIRLAVAEKFVQTLCTLEQDCPQPCQ